MLILHIYGCHTSSTGGTSSSACARLAESKEVQVTEGELNSRIHQMAASQGMRPEQVKGELEKSGGLQNLAMQVREQKVLDSIVDEGELTDISAEEWNARTAADKA